MDVAEGISKLMDVKDQNCRSFSQETGLIME